MCQKVNLFIGSVEQSLSKLHGATALSALNIPINEDDQHYFVFTIPSQGSWTFTWLPNGWVNSPAFYISYIARPMSMLLVGKALSYIDNILLYFLDPIGEEIITLLDKFLA